MRKRISYCLLVFSAMLLLGHSVLPHQHSDFNSSVVKVTRHEHMTIADFFQLIFSQNLGTNHLTEYRDCQAKTLINSPNHQPDFALLTSDDSRSPANFLFYFFAEVNFSPSGRHHLTGSLLRAPPALA